MYRHLSATDKSALAVRGVGGDLPANLLFTHHMNTANFNTRLMKHAIFYACTMVSIQ